MTGKKKGIIIGIIIAVIAAAAATWFGTANMRAYSQAVKDYDAGNYEKAQETFAGLGDYNDSAERVTACTYQLAEADFNKKDYQAAHDKYVSVKDYEDAADKANECIYVLADADYQAEDFEAALEKYQSIAGYKDADDKTADCTYQLSTDGRFLRELAKGLMERWDQSDQDEKDGSIGKDEAKCYENYCSIELKHVEQFENEKFDDKKLGKAAKKYIGMIRDAIEATSYATVDINKYYTDWGNVYSKRTQLLQKFVSEYDLKVDEAHQETLNDMMRDASAAARLDAAKSEIEEMSKAFTISIVKDEYGYKEYAIHMENTTQYTFDYFYVDFNLLDENGNIVDTGNADQVTNWAPGQAADVSAWISSNVDPAGYKIQMKPHYSTADGTIYA